VEPLPLLVELELKLFLWVVVCVCATAAGGIIVAPAATVARTSPACIKFEICVRIAG
jgi:hypothetical protein